MNNNGVYSVIQDLTTAIDDFGLGADSSHASDDDDHFYEEEEQEEKQEVEESLQQQQQDQGRLDNKSLNAAGDRLLVKDREPPSRLQFSLAHDEKTAVEDEKTQLDNEFTPMELRFSNDFATLPDTLWATVNKAEEKDKTQQEPVAKSEKELGHVNRHAPVPWEHQQPQPLREYRQSPMSREHQQPRPSEEKLSGEYQQMWSPREHQQPQRPKEPKEQLSREHQQMHSPREHSQPQPAREQQQQQPQREQQQLQSSSLGEAHNSGQGRKIRKKEQHKLVVDTSRPEPPTCTSPCSYILSCPSSTHSKRPSVMSARSIMIKNSAQQQQQQERPSQQHRSRSRKYRARSYAEMMRVPDPQERLAFYNQTYQSCLRSDSQLSAWITKQKAKGPPKPLTEGYQPPPRPAVLSPEPPETPNSSAGSLHTSRLRMSGSFSSIFARKSHTAAMNRPGALRGADTPKPSSSRSFLPQTFSRLTLSSRSTTAVAAVTSPSMKNATAKRSSQVQPHPSQSTNKPPRLPSGSGNAKKVPTKRHKKRTASIDSNATAAASAAGSGRWGSIHFSRRSTKPPPPLPATPAIQVAGLPAVTSPSLLSSTTTASSSLSRHNKTEEEETALDRMCNNLPDMDRGVLEDYLIEAGGDWAVAVTLALSQQKKFNKASSGLSSNPTATSPRSVLRA